VTKLFVKGIEISALNIFIEGFQYGRSIPIVGDFLRLTYIENPGMAFGIDFGYKLFFSLFSIAASIGILVYLFKARNENLMFRTSLAMILGGAVGNLIDRVFYGVIFNEAPLFYGKVVDFIDVDFFNIDFLGYHLSRWPVFNIADASVTLGVVLMLFSHRVSEKASGEPVPDPDVVGTSPVSASSSSSSAESAQP
jgi:signal peptidase II